MILHRASLAALVATSAGQLACSEIVGIEDRSGSWCTLEAADSDFCDDFDHDPPFAAWAASGSPQTTTSDRSQPNALLARTGTTLSRSFLGVEGNRDFSVALDLRFGGPSPPGGSEETGPSDHAVLRVWRGDGTVGLFASSAGRLSFGVDSLGEALPTTLAEDRWKHFVISIEGNAASANATLEVDGEMFGTVVVKAEGSGEGDDEKGSSVLIGAAPLLPDSIPIECIIDNVTVNGAGVAP